ncbi:MAG: adenylate/guanylate cyclase domain-containing protein [Fidelibacterota bacterium]
MENYHEEGLVFFTDLTNFFHSTKGIKTEQVADLLTTFAEITNSTVNSGSGQVIDYMGDSALGFFPAKLADQGVRTLMDMKHQVEEWLITEGYKMKLRVGAHYGPFMVIFLPPFTTPDILGETANIAVRLGSGGQSSHRGRFILSAAAFRKLAPETRKSFHKYTEPIVYLAEE